MSVKKTLLYGFTIAIILVFSTWYIGHLWVFIILILSSIIGIALSTIRESEDNKNSKKSNDD
jgi:UPF0716 family protein affecting phage T7 exclusion